MASESRRRLRERPQRERNAIFLTYVSGIFVILGVVVLIFDPKLPYVGYASFAAAVAQLGMAGWNWSRRGG